MQAVCDTLLGEWTEEHGYHAACYRKFTRHADRLEKSTIRDTDPHASSSHRSRSNQRDGAIFKPDCIFCNSKARKILKRQGYKTTEGLCMCDFGGCVSIQHLAEARNDENL